MKEDAKKAEKGEINMLNLFAFTGIVSAVKLEDKEDHPAKCEIEIKVKRPFANYQGLYEDDVFTIEVWRGKAAELSAQAHPGDVLMAKGRIASRRDGIAFVADQAELIK